MRVGETVGGRRRPPDPATDSEPKGACVSDLLWWLLQPSGLLLALVGVVAVAALAGARRLASGLALLALAAWVGVTLLPIGAWLAAPLEERHPLPERLPARVDGIVVLGGSVDWRGSAALGQLQLGASGERMAAAAALARRYPQALLAFTGVTAEALAHDFVPSASPASLFAGPEYEDRRIVVLPGAGSTYEEALLLLERVAPRPGETWLLVTSAWHMPRAWSTFRTLGWTLRPYPVDALAAGARWGWPSLPGAAQRLAELDTVVREWGALAVYRRSGRIAPEVGREPGTVAP
jgi:uncharacterized SAM-binding protein YcdF (DUF218 family)